VSRALDRDHPMRPAPTGISSRLCRGEQGNGDEYYHGEGDSKERTSRRARRREKRRRKQTSEALCEAIPVGRIQAKPLRRLTAGSTLGEMNWRRKWP